MCLSVNSLAAEEAQDRSTSIYMWRRTVVSNARNEGLSPVDDSEDESPRFLPRSLVVFRQRQRKE